MPDPVIFEELQTLGGQRLGIVSLNTEKTINPLSLAMIDLLTGQLKAWQSDDAIPMVILQVAGEKTSSEEEEIQDLYESMVRHSGGPNDYAEAFFESEYRLNYLLRTYQKPVICWAHGIVTGGGLGIMAACSHRLGTEGTILVMPEINMGHFPDAGASWFLARMEPHLAWFMSLTACQINARDALKAGLVDYLISWDKKAAITEALLAENWHQGDKINTPDHIGKLEKIIARFQTRANDFLPGPMECNQDIILRLYEKSIDADNFVTEFRDVFAQTTLADQWLERAFRNFLGGCPTTAYIVKELLERSSGLTFKETLMMELVIAVQCSRHPDFTEGIRALFIDKDHQPAWQFGDIQNVPGEWVAEHFISPWENNPLNDLDEK